MAMDMTSSATSGAENMNTNWLTLGLCFLATVLEGLDLQSMGVAATEFCGSSFWGANWRHDFRSYRSKTSADCVGGFVWRLFLIDSLCMGRQLTNWYPFYHRPGNGWRFAHDHCYCGRSRKTFS